MIKATGTFLIILATTLMGIEASRSAQNQYMQMLHLQKLIYRIRSEIQYKRAYLEDAFLFVGKSEEEPYRSWLLQMGKELESRDNKQISQIWKEQTKRWISSVGLPKKEYHLLMELGKNMGMEDLEMQVKSLDLFLEELIHGMDELRPVIKNKIRLYHCLGVMSGVFLSVLLI